MPRRARAEWWQMDRLCGSTCIAPASLRVERPQRHWAIKGDGVLTPGRSPRLPVTHKTTAVQGKSGLGSFGTAPTACRHGLEGLPGLRDVLMHVRAAADGLPVGRMPRAPARIAAPGHGRVCHEAHFPRAVQVGAPEGPSVRVAAAEWRTR